MGRFVPASSPLKLSVVKVIPPALVVLVGFVAMTVYAVAQWRALAAPSWDLAIFTELAKAYANFEAPIVPIKGEGYNLLGDHFHPILVLLAIPYWIYPSGLSLLITQALLLALSAWPITRLAVHLTGRWAGTALGLAYVLSWGFQGAVEAQFHEIAFAVPLLAYSAVAFVQRRWVACLAWAAPLVLVKEDMGLVVLMVGLAIALRGRYPGGNHAPDPKAVRLGLLTAVCGALAFLVTVLVLLPAMNPDGVWAYGLNNDDPTRAERLGILGRFLQPADKKLATLAVLVVAAGVIGLASPWMLLVLPTIAWRFLGSVEFYWDWQRWHYNAVLVPVAFGALLDVLTRLREGSRPEAVVPTWNWRALSLARPWLRGLVVTAVLLPLVGAAWTARDLPFWGAAQGRLQASPERVSAAQQVLAAVPEGATVSSDLTLLARLVPQATVYWVGTAPGDTDYVLVDTRGAGWSARPDAKAFAERASKTGATYTKVLNVEGFELAKRNG
ncbi:Predicted membrane protein [Actinomyces bovis]|uniref:Predicted membrane protein n=2 Tax=Actinomyces bovis TaxID=1658 RepID=A0ABY1VRQ7_9ACTO|nr:Predicted membrane protein [Actinomyces bovis]VEG55983.1 Predicted membrane protein [Actinomyces israelii]